MNIVHCILRGPYSEGYGYQENMLPYYHANLGHSVTVICTQFSRKKGEDKFVLLNPGESVDSNGVHVVRLKLSAWKTLSTRLGFYPQIIDVLNNKKPDLIFIHGCQSFAPLYAIIYKRKHECVRVVIDNHSDRHNSASFMVSAIVQHKILWHAVMKYSEKKLDRIFAVTPSRAEFLVDYYHINPNRIDLLVMGADDEAIKKSIESNARTILRDKYSITDRSIVVLVGGKINSRRLDIINFIRDFVEVGLDNAVLFVFGSISEEIRVDFDCVCQNEAVRYVGWLNNQEIYDYFQMSDIVCFPGLHSVLWEQAVGSGKPCLFKEIKGFDHIDVGGNCAYLHSDDYKSEIMRYINWPSINKMNLVSSTTGKKVFSYYNIAQKCLMED